MSEIVNSKKWYPVFLKGVLLCTGAIIIVRQGWFASITDHMTVETLIAGAVVQPIIILGLFIQGVRHKVLISKPEIGVGSAFRGMVLSQGLNIVLPARLSELLKATYLRDRANVPLSVGLSAVVLERSVDVLIFALLGVLGSIQFFDKGNFVSMSMLGIALVVIVFLVVRFPRLVLCGLSAIPSLQLSGFLERTYLHFSAIAYTRRFWNATLLGIAVWGLSFINILVFLQVAGSLPIGFSGVLLVFVMTTLGGAIPALPGGLGTYEAAAVVALRSLGYGFDEALALAIALHVFQLALPFFWAICILLTDRIGISNLVSDLRKSAEFKAISSEKIKTNLVND